MGTAFSTSTAPNSTSANSNTSISPVVPAILQVISAVERATYRMEPPKRTWYHSSSSPVPINSNTLPSPTSVTIRSEEHTSELQSRGHLVCRLLLAKKN